MKRTTLKGNFIKSYLVVKLQKCFCLTFMDNLTVTQESFYPLTKHQALVKCDRLLFLSSLILKNQSMNKVSYYTKYFSYFQIHYIPESVRFLLSLFCIFDFLGFI